MSSSRTIPQIEAEIQAIKDANPDWLVNSGDKALITALTIEKNGVIALTAPAGKSPF
jgi:3',5'-cyclic AMP phosphodiesterase CpdA